MVLSNLSPLLLTAWTTSASATCRFSETWLLIFVFYSAPHPLEFWNFPKQSLTCLGLQCKSKIQDDEPGPPKKPVDTTPMTCLCNPSSSLRLCSVNSWLKNCNNNFVYCLCPQSYIICGVPLGLTLGPMLFSPNRLKTCDSIVANQRLHCGDGAHGCWESHNGKSWSFLWIFFEINSIKHLSALRPTNLW